MKFYKYLLPLFAFVGFAATSSVVAIDPQDGSRFEEELNERDFDALKEFLNAKRITEIKEGKGANLVISGDVRTEYRHLNERLKGIRLRGGNASEIGDLNKVFHVEPTSIGGCPVRGRPISRNDFDIEFNLRFDYITDRAWASAHVQYDNSAGVDDNDHVCCLPSDPYCKADPEGYHGSGYDGDLRLRKAYMGYNLWANKCSHFDVELGRRGNLYNVFDSKVQFLSRLDGIFLKYDSSWEDVADWYVHAAGFVVDERVNHFAWIAEVGMLNIYDMNIDFKYSIIDWEKHGKNRCFVRNPKGFKYVNSQFTAAYHLNPELLTVPATFYGAFVCNHAANKVRIGNHKYRQNLAWYLGFTAGKVKKEGDWAIDMQYQVVQAFAIPDEDVSGICNGNVLNESITTCANRGNTNFIGWKVEGLYAITDSLTLDTIVEWSRAYKKAIGGRHTYSKLELEAIYAF